MRRGAVRGRERVRVRVRVHERVGAQSVHDARTIARASDAATDASVRERAMPPGGRRTLCLVRASLPRRRGKRGLDSAVERSAHARSMLTAPRPAPSRRATSSLILPAQRMRITFDVTFPSLPCAAVSVDSQDASGTASLDVLHNVFKRRLTAAGSPVGEAEHTGDGTPGGRPGGTLKSPAELLREREKAAAAGRPVGPTASPAAAPDAALEGAAERARAAAAPGTAACGSCYGAGAEGECCGTCESVREGYRRRGWQFNMRGVAQCEKEGFYGDVSAQLAAGEGCNLFGFLEVPLVPGNFHFAPGHAMQHAYAHVHDLVQFAHEAFNSSHTVNSVAFTAAGEEPQQVAAAGAAGAAGAAAAGAAGAAGAGAAAGGSVLDGRSLILTEGTGMHQYFCKLVPTVFVPLGALAPAPGAVAAGGGLGGGLGAAPPGPRPRYAFDFSVTEHLRRLDARANTQQAQLEAATGLLPGLFFNYETSPIRVRRVEKRRSLIHFLTEVAAIVGGVMTIGSFVDALVGLVGEHFGREQRKRAAAGGGLVT
jgi:hypothetical protein